MEFDATVTAYWKGYHDNRHMDYKLSRPTRVRILSSAGEVATGEDPNQFRLALTFAS